MSLGAKPAQYQQMIPQDTQGVRGNQLSLFEALLKPGGFQGLESYFGGLGSQPTALQRQATGGISQYLNQPAPEQRALETSLPALQGILNGRPGQGIMDALQPHFDRNLASANQQGGRFGSANAILRSRAVEDYNLLGARAAETGINQQMQAAQVLSLLANSAGQNPFARLVQGANVGAGDAQQADLETQRRLQLMSMLMGGAQGVAFNNPWVQTRQASGGLGGLLGGLLGTAAGSFFGPIGAAAGAKVGGKIFGGK